MSKIHQKVIKAFLEGKSCKVSNTMTNGSELFLFNNCIARRDRERIQVTTAGWNTVTTRDRLSMLPGVWVRCRKGNLQINFTNDQSEWKDWYGEWINVEKIFYENNNR